jgi:hypothetical protein
VPSRTCSESAGDSHVDHRLFVFRGHDPTPSGLLVLGAGPAGTTGRQGKPVIHCSVLRESLTLPATGRLRTRSRPAHRALSEGCRDGRASDPSVALVP